MSESLFKTFQLKFNDEITYADISIPFDKATFIVGKNGSGKTTLFRLLNKTLTPKEGEIRYIGYPLSDYDAIRLRKEVSLISQSVYLFDCSIKKNFEKFYAYRNLPLPSDDTIKEYLNICCLPFALNSDCRILSGGERQRVYIAIYLSLNPKVILLDEPTSALDDENSDTVVKNIIGYCAQNHITPIIISHDQTIVKKFSQNTIRIK